ncbi:hypothetical protein K458DRAFT_462121 [Lentithecium fluviatile CBS 122367]|uniref:Uncharacterized protein n=1 Tax=Lentithecium fluviatile CBS 122367 TaxID=1168545 RepID=A0A6G1JF99_9PLEO|nr:hypothetical protein K458DRAFT_462121 [Lentithecium fluviatile CBS 122367]
MSTHLPKGRAMALVLPPGRQAKCSRTPNPDACFDYTRRIDFGNIGPSVRFLSKRIQYNTFDIQQRAAGTAALSSLHFTSRTRDPVLRRGARFWSRLFSRGHILPIRSSILIGATVRSRKETSFLQPGVSTEEISCYSAVILLTLNLNYLHVDDSDVDVKNSPLFGKWSGLPLWLGLLNLSDSVRNMNLPRQFDHLHTLRINMTRIELNDLDETFGLPSLRRPKLDHVNHYFGIIARDRWCCITRSSSITSLYVDERSVNTLDIELLILSVKYLQYLRWDYAIAGSYGHPSKIPTLHYPALSKALLEHEDTLEDLHIANRFDLTGLETQGPNDDYLDNLPELRRLKHMDFGIRAFKPHNHPESNMDDHPASIAGDLPANTEKLDIFIDDQYAGNWYATMLDFAFALDPSLPHLLHKREDRIYIRKQLSKAL